MSKRARPGEPGSRSYTEKMLANPDFRNEFREFAIECGDITKACDKFKLHRSRLYTLSVEDGNLRDWFSATREAVHWYLVDSVPQIVEKKDLETNEKKLRVWAAFMQADRLVPALSKNLRGGQTGSVNITAHTLQIVTEEQRARLTALLESKQRLEGRRYQETSPDVKSLPDIEATITENNNGSHNQQDAIRQ